MTDAVTCGAKMLTFVYSKQANMDQAKIERLLVLMMELSDNEQTTVDDLARRFHTTTRTIYRYLDSFEDAGFAVNKVSPKVYSLTKLGDKIVDFGKLVMFSQEEAFVVRNLISQLDNSNSFKKTLAMKLSAVAGSKSIADFVVNKATSRQAQMLHEAMEKHRQVILHDYESGHTKTISDRLVEPFKFTTNLADVLAYEPSSGMVKTFKISRMKEVEVTQTPWKFKSLHKEYPQDAFRMTGEMIYPVKLELSLRAKSLLEEEFPMALKDLHRTSTGKWILNTKVSKMEGIGRFVMGLAAEVKILEGPELIEYIRDYSGHIAKLIGEKA